jgi:SAM-dependent methyltransferase
MNSETVFPASLSPQRVVEQFVNLLYLELSFRRQRQMDDFFLQLKYESGLFSRQGAFNHLAVCAYAARLSPLLTEIRRRRFPTLLDSGAGCGSESILAALLGAEVTGIDLVPFKTEYAASRIPYFQGIGHRPLPLRFLNANVIRHLRGAAAYDLIWANEAISHIHPAEEFIAAAHQGLNPGGLLIIADANGLNPVARWRAARIRGDRDWYVHRGCNLGDDEPLDDVAEERLFTCRTLPRALVQAGFRIRRVEMHGFLGSFFLPLSWQRNPLVGKMLAGFQRGIRRVPLVRAFGSSMTVIAEKGGTL